MMLIAIRTDGFSPASIKTKAIIVPGMGGSSLYQYREPTIKERIWPSPFAVKELGVSHDKDGRCILDDPRTGVESIGTRHDGILSGDWMSRMMLGSTFYKPLMDTLHGKQLEIHTFPYDFRRLMDVKYLEELYQEMEEFMEKEEECQYIVYCHSLGGLLFHDFLHSTTERVRARIRDVVYVNTPFDGSAVAVPFLVGLPITKMIMMPREIAKKLRNFGGFYWCLPWKEDQEVVLYKDRTFRVSELDELFHVCGMTAEYNLYRKSILPRKRARLAAPPHVSIRTHLFYSRAMEPTPIFYNLDKNSRRHDKEGDGVVSHSSILTDWASSHKAFPNTDHSSILSDPGFLSECRKLIS